MTADRSGDGTPPERETLSQAEALYETAAGVFAIALDEARDGGAAAAQVAAEYAREFREALHAVLKERATLEKLRRDSSGYVPGTGLDFERARAEIGRRLACLRDAAGDG